jgi:hypothetical protein
VNKIALAAIVIASCWAPVASSAQGLGTYWQSSALNSPESLGQVDWPGRIYQATWTYTATNRLLVEAGYNFQVTVQGAVQIDPIGVPCGAWRGQNARAAKTERSG